MDRWEDTFRFYRWLMKGYARKVSGNDENLPHHRMTEHTSHRKSVYLL